MDSKFALATTAAIAALSVSVPATAVTRYNNEASGVGYDFSTNNYLFSVFKSTVDGSPATASGFVADGFASAQATKTNNGTATATASGQTYYFSGSANTFFETTFDFSPSTKGRITLKLTGWAIANGSGIATIGTSIQQNGSVLANSFTYSSESPALAFPTKPGLQKLSLIKTLNWKGGDTLDITTSAQATVFGDYTITDNPLGPGFASAYIDPVIDISISSVPEPASWAMLIAGFGLTGAAMRRRGARAVPA
jgi:hypothetical protein